MKWPKRALISTLSLGALLLVGSCGYGGLGPSTGDTARGYKRYEITNSQGQNYGVTRWCADKDMIFQSGNATAVVHNHEECAG